MALAFWRLLSPSRDTQTETYRGGGGIARNKMRVQSAAAVQDKPVPPADQAVDDDRKAMHARHLAGECDRYGRRYQEGER